MTFGLLQHAINFGLGVLFRFLNENQKDKQLQLELSLAAATGKHEFLVAARQNVSKTPVLQFFLGMLLTVSLAALISFPILAIAWDVPLLFVFERAVTSGWWIFSSTINVTTLEETQALYLPKEFQIVIIAILEFITGAIVGGLGRR